METEYEYIEQIEEKNTCSRDIPEGLYEHEGECKCDANHTCGDRCPDCGSLCRLDVDHPERKHETYHRNQDSVKIVSENADHEVCVDDRQNRKFIFNVGDNLAPYHCG